MRLSVQFQSAFVITFRVRRSRGEMYSGHQSPSHDRLCVCLSLASFPHYCTDLDVTWENGRRCLLAVHCWADLQSVHGFRCYDNIAPNANCQRVLVLALCLVVHSDLLTSTVWLVYRVVFHDISILIKSRAHLLVYLLHVLGVRHTDHLTLTSDLSPTQVFGMW